MVRGDPQVDREMQSWLVPLFSSLQVLQLMRWGPELALVRNCVGLDLLPLKALTGVLYSRLLSGRYDLPVTCVGWKN